MNRKVSLLFFVVVLGIPGHAHAQSASGIIAHSRMIDWSNAGVQGGIPNRTTICATLNPGATPSQINSAIASCPSGGVVYLNAGTYNLASGIDFAGHSNVTLRGAGPDKTFLVFTGGVRCNGASGSICIGGDPIYSNPNNLANITGGLSQGSTQITLSVVNGSLGNLKVGSYINFDQINDSSDPGTVFVCDTQGVCSQEGTGGVYRSGRAQNQLPMVTAINGNTVTFSPGLYMPNWRASQNPQAFWPANQASMDGIEDLSVDNSSNTSSLNAISINSASNSWVKNVRTLNPLRDHVMLRNTAHCTIKDSYFYGTQSGTTSEYGVEPDEDSSSLVINNIFQHIVSPILPGPDSGSVYAYNYAIDDWYSPSPYWLQASLNAHAAGTAFDLYEGNEGESFQSDDIHGTHNFMTLFRNRLLGWDVTWGTPPVSGANNTEPVEIQSFGRYYNLIGNVLGYPGYHTQYEDLAPDGTNMAKSIYVLGWSGNGGKTAHDPNDPNVVSTLMRWGNFDVATDSVRWNTSEVPSGLSLFANPVPSNQTLPASFFLSGKPDWWTTPWGTPPWPAIGPDVTGGPGPGGHSYDIPAKLCYKNASKDSNGVLDFNATKCYQTSAAPSPPTGLTTTPH